MADCDENENESEQRTNVVPIEVALLEDIASLHRRVKALEARVEAIEAGDNTGFKHENDGGWFD